MKSSNRLFLVLAGIAYILLAVFLFANPALNIAAIAWMFSLGLFVSALSAIFTYFTLPREARHGIYLWQGILEALFGLYLLAYGYVSLPVVVPTVLGFWLIFEAVFIFIRGRQLSLVLPIIGSNVSWYAFLLLVLGLVLLFHPMLASLFVLYLLAAGFLIAGVQYILEAFRK